MDWESNLCVGPLFLHLTRQVAGCHGMPTHSCFALQLRPGPRLALAEGGLPSVPHPWAMDFQETGGKLPTIASLPCGTCGCQAGLLPRQLPVQAGRYRLYKGELATPYKAPKE